MTVRNFFVQDFVSLTIGISDRRADRQILDSAPSTGRRRAGCAHGRIAIPGQRASGDRSPAPHGRAARGACRDHSRLPVERAPGIPGSEAAAFRLLPHDGHSTLQQRPTGPFAPPLAGPDAGHGRPGGLVAQHLSRHVFDEHAALDLGRPGGPLARDTRAANPGRVLLRDLRALPFDGPRLRGCGPELGLRRLRARCNTDRGGRHDGGHQATRACAQRFHHPAPGGRLLR